MAVIIRGVTNLSSSNTLSIFVPGYNPSVGPISLSPTVTLDITFSGGAGPTEGLMIYNTDTHHYYGFDGSVWQELYYFSDVPA